MSFFHNYRTVLSLAGVLLAVLLSTGALFAGTGKFKLIRAAEMGGTPQGDKLISWARGDVVFATESGRIYCDSAEYIQGKDAILIGSVVIDEA